MPTYRNDTGSVVMHKGERINAGDMVATVEYLTKAGMTKLSDAPYYNPYQFYTKLTFANSGTQTVTIPDPSTCPIVRLQKLSAGISVNVYLGDKTANPIPVVMDWDIYDPILEVDTEYSVGALVIEATGAGSVHVLGLSDLSMEIDDNE
jgi:hypothetical protein